MMTRAVQSHQAGCVFETPVVAKKKNVWLTWNMETLSMKSWTSSSSDDFSFNRSDSPSKTKVTSLKTKQECNVMCRDKSNYILSLDLSWGAYSGYRLLGSFHANIKAMNIT